MIICRYRLFSTTESLTQILFKFDYINANWAQNSRYNCSNLRNMKPNSVHSTDQVDTMLSNLNIVIQTTRDLSIPKLKIRSLRKPIPIEIWHLMQLRNNTRRNWQQYKLIHSKDQNSLLSALEKWSYPFSNLTKVLRKKHSNIPMLKIKQSIRVLLLKNMRFLVKFLVEITLHLLIWMILLLKQI